MTDMLLPLSFLFIFGIVLFRLGIRAVKTQMYMLHARTDLLLSTSNSGWTLRGKPAVVLGYFAIGVSLILIIIGSVGAFQVFMK